MATNPLAKRAGQVALANPCWPSDEKILMVFDPFVVLQGKNFAFNPDYSYTRGIATECHFSLI